MSTTTTVQHQPWCNHHVEAWDKGHPGWCQQQRQVPSGATVAVIMREPEEGGLGIDLWGGRECFGDTNVTPQEARQVAAWLIEAAEMIEEASR